MEPNARAAFRSPPSVGAFATCMLGKATGTIPGPMLQVRLPPAAPEDYLRWITWFRGVEQAMLRDPEFEDWASRAASAPFLEGPVALFLSHMAGAILSQAGDAKRSGRPLVQPELEGPDQFWEDAADYMETRGGWLDETLDGAPLAIVKDLKPLDEDLRQLRGRVVAEIRRCLREKTD